MFQPGYDADRLRVIVYNGKTRRDVTKTWQQTAISLAFSPDSQTIYTTADEHGHLKIFAINLQTEEIKTLTHEHTATLVCMAKNDLIFRLASMNHPHVIHRLNTTTLELKPYGTTPELQALFKGVDLPKPEEFWFEGALGDKVHGWLLKPANFEQGKKYPVAFLVHGGPQMPFRDNWYVLSIDLQVIWTAHDNHLTYTIHHTPSCSISFLGFLTGILRYTRRQVMQWLASIAMAPLGSDENFAIVLAKTGGRIHI